MTGTERFTSDTKDVDITGAMFVCNNGLNVFLCCFQQGVVLAIDWGRLMGDPVRSFDQKCPLNSERFNLTLLLLTFLMRTSFPEHIHRPCTKTVVHIENNVYQNI